VLPIPRTILGRSAQFTTLLNGFMVGTGPPPLRFGSASTSLPTVSTASAFSVTTQSNLAATRPSFSASGAFSPQSAGIMTWQSPGSRPIRALPRPRRWVTPLQTASPPEVEQAHPERHLPFCLLSPLRPRLGYPVTCRSTMSRHLPCPSGHYPYRVRGHSWGLTDSPSG